MSHHPVRPAVATTRALASVAVLFCLLVGLAACGDTPPTDPGCVCADGSACEFGLCPEDLPDAGDAGDVADVTDATDDPDPSDSDMDQVECTVDTEDDDCDADEFCNEAQECEAGCRIDNCDDCSLFPEGCEDGWRCRPSTHECVAGCVDDSECADRQYCAEDGLCEDGCRTNPDNCPEAPVGTPELTCNSEIHRCEGGPCDADQDCLEGFYCHTRFETCVEGCRSSPVDSCGSGFECDEDDRTCEQRTCECEPGDDPEKCDGWCDDNGRVSAYYCDDETDTCEFGCRIRDDGTDTCRLGTLCDPDTRICIDGCGEDDDCPFGTYCDTRAADPVCVAGCKPGECGKDRYCCVDTRMCCSEDCLVDSDCYDDGETYNGLYCADGSCTEGCLPDDVETVDLDEDSCFGELVCNRETRVCEIPRCDPEVECGACPVGLVCDSRSERCVPGCDDDCHCPSGQVCSEATGQCGCLDDDECPDGTHCTTPECEIDCVPETDTTDDSCPDPLVCDPETGRCTGDCIDRAETTANDTRGSATCVAFSAGDPVASAVACTGTTEPQPCDDEPDTWCTEATACTGADFDWYVMSLRAGDTVDVYAEDPDIGWGFLNLTVQSASGTICTGRSEGEANDLVIENCVIAADGIYYINLFTVGADAVEYDLEVRLHRPFACEADVLESNDNTDQATSLGDAGRLIDRTYNGLTMCTADRDFFSMFLVAGQRMTTIVDSVDGQPGLRVALGVGAEDLDLDPATLFEAGNYDNPSDLGDLDDRAIQNRRINASDEYFVRVDAADRLSEAEYSIHVESFVGEAACEKDPYEGVGRDSNNDTPEATIDLRASQFIPTGLNEAIAFENASICPAQDGVPLDVDYYLVQAPGAGGGFLQAAIVQPDNALRMDIFSWPLTGSPTTVSTIGSPTGQLLTNAALNPSPSFYLVRVSSTNPGDDELIPTLGETYTLRLDYVGEPCEDDLLEPNPFDNPDLLHSETFPTGWEQSCADPFTTDCQSGEDSFCECLPVDDLVMCPATQDWFNLRLLRGDRYAVRVRVLGDDASANAAKMAIRLYFPQCENPADCRSTCDGGGTCHFTQPSPSGADFLVTGTAQTLPGSIFGTYVLEVDAGLLTEGVDYEIDVEIDGAGGRDCPPDVWDQDPDEWIDFPGANESACQAASCKLTAENSRSGALCSWDRQDWFEFTTDGGDIELYVGFQEVAGNITADVYTFPFPVGSDATLFGCGPDYDDCPCAFGLDPENRVACQLQTTRPEIVGDFPGVEYALYDLPAGTYQVRVRPDPFLGATANPDYTISINDDACGGGIGSGGKTLWSVAEECEGDRIVACGGSACSSSTCTCD